MDTVKICDRCGKHCVPVQSYCPKCGDALPAAVPGSVPSPVGTPHLLILNKGSEKRVIECDSMEAALDQAVVGVMNGYIARVADKNGVVKFTQAQANGQVAMYSGDATNQAARPASGQMPAPGSRKPWWRFW